MEFDAVKPQPDVRENSGGIAVSDRGDDRPKQPAIAIRRLNFSYKEAVRPKQVLFDIDLEILPGEVALLTGPSGCGKTTLLTLIGGLRTVQDGELVVLGRQLHRSAAGELAEVRRHIGFIFQMHNLLDFLTAQQNVRMALQLHSELRRQDMEVRAQGMLARVGLSAQHNSYPNQLSGGQKQRVSIARALAGHPKLILADEPTSALDSKTGREVIDLLVHLARHQHCPILMVTHDTRIADMADRIIQMEDGRIISR